jgi:hypothetical protein
MFLLYRFINLTSFNANIIVHKQNLKFPNVHIMNFRKDNLPCLPWFQMAKKL